MRKITVHPSEAQSATDRKGDQRRRFRPNASALMGIFAGDNVEAPAVSRSGGG